MCVVPVRFRPSPPTEVVRRSKSYEGSELNLLTNGTRSDVGVEPEEIIHNT